MDQRIILRTSKGRATERWAIRLASVTVTSVALLGSAIGQTAPASPMALWVTDPVTAAQCLAGEGCGKSAAAACVAEQTIKAAPPALKAEALAMSRSKATADCRATIAELAIDRDKYRELYQRAPRTIFSDEYVQSVRNYFAACLASPQLALNQGSVTPAQTHFLKKHTGLILRRDNPNWPGPQPICQAARLGRFIVTAERCIPEDIRAKTHAGDYVPTLGFRFLDSPTVYGIGLHRLGTDKGALAEQLRSYAIFEIPGTPALEEDIEPLLGTMQPLGDFIVITAHLTAVLSRGLQTAAAVDYTPVTTIHKNTLCRPGFVSADGLFLHSCLIDSALSVGVPLFQRQNGRYVFVGIHVGDTITLQQPSLAACAPGLNKFGIAIPPALLRDVFSK